MSDSLIDDINKFKEIYYKDNKKNIFQKKSLKYEVAKVVTDRFDIYVLLQKTVYKIPNTNKIFINYLMFKKFAQPENYGLFVRYVQNLASITIDEKNTFECHIDIESFTISAAERYRGVIDKFSEGVFGYTEYMDAIYIYNSPTMIERISKLLLNLIDQSTKNKIILVSKPESEKIIEGFRKKHSNV